MMKSSLIVYDMTNFLVKYTRFMTKNVYISNITYQRFLKQYQYLIDELRENAFLYQDQLDYQKILNIYKNQKKMLKLHNQKYLKAQMMIKNDFFSKLYPKDILDKNKCMMILSEEETMFTLNQKHTVPLVVGKIKYLTSVLKMPLFQILVLTNDAKELGDLEKELKAHNLDNCKVMTLKQYGVSTLKEGENLLVASDLYSILEKYITRELFPQKEKFQAFYAAFQNEIYLNRDYLDFDTFKDYHCYLYKRKFLASKLSYKKFNEQEIKKRRTYLRSLHSEFLSCKEEVDIANFLTLNSIPYQYIKEESVFQCSTCHHQTKIYYQVWNDDYLAKHLGEDIIVLTSDTEGKNNYLEKLAYELIKRQYPFEQLSEQEVYNMLRDTTIDSYFSEFITNLLIPAMKHYQNYHHFNQTQLTNEQKAELEKIYTYYENYLASHFLVDELMMQTRIEEKLNAAFYQYVIFMGDISIKYQGKYLKIIPNYREIGLIQANIKLLYDYKKYLNDNKVLPVLNSFTSEEEFNHLTNSFLKDNLIYLNQRLMENKKAICVCFYEEENRLLVYKKLTAVVSNIIHSLSDTASILMAFQQLKEMKILLGTGGFSKVNQNTLQDSDKRELPCSILSNISKNYSTIILPYLIKDNYHIDLLEPRASYQVKVGIYVALSKCRDGIYLLCPMSKRQEISNLLSTMPNVSIFRV